MKVLKKIISYEDGCQVRRKRAAAPPHHRLRWSICHSESLFSPRTHLAQRRRLFESREENRREKRGMKPFPRELDKLKRYKASGGGILVVGGPCLHREEVGGKAKRDEYEIKRETTKMNGFLSCPSWFYSSQQRERNRNS